MRWKIISKKWVECREEKVQRKSNIELLRIICMLMIIADHLCSQNDVVETNSYFDSLFFAFLTCGARISCSIFIVISGFYNRDKTINLKRIFNIWLTCIFYTVGLTAVVRWFELGGWTITAWFPIMGLNLWFTSAYSIICIVAPILNVGIDEMKKRDIEVMLAIAFLLMSIVPTISLELGAWTNEIYPLVWVYCVTRYINKYYKSFWKDFRKLFLGIDFVFVFLLVFVRAWAMLKGLNVLALYLDCFRTRLQTMPNLIFAFAIFGTFMNLDIKFNKVVNYLASLTFGIYCFHQVPSFIPVLWNEIFRVDSNSTKAMLIITIVGVFFFGATLETIRKKIVHIIVISKVYIRGSEFGQENTEKDFVRNMIIAMGIVIGYCVIIRACFPI